MFVHPRSPYHRVDVLESSRRVEVKIDGVTVADSRRPRFLFETDLPTRYYLPKLDVRMDLLRPESLKTRCPYKGVASYWSVVIDGKKFENLICAGTKDELLRIHPSRLESLSRSAKLAPSG